MGSIEKLIDCMRKEGAEIELEKKAIARASGMSVFSHSYRRHRKGKPRKSKIPERELFKNTFGPVAGIQ